MTMKMIITRFRMNLRVFGVVLLFTEVVQVVNIEVVVELVEDLEDVDETDGIYMKV